MCARTVRVVPVASAVLEAWAARKMMTLAAATMTTRMTMMMMMMKKTLMMRTTVAARRAPLEPEPDDEVQSETASVSCTIQRHDH